MAEPISISLKASPPVLLSSIRPGFPWKHREKEDACSRTHADIDCFSSFAYFEPPFSFLEKPNPHPLIGIVAESMLFYMDSATYPHIILFLRFQIKQSALISTDYTASPARFKKADQESGQKNSLPLDSIRRPC